MPYYATSIGFLPTYGNLIGDNMKHVTQDFDSVGCLNFMEDNIPRSFFHLQPRALWELNAPILGYQEADFVA